MKKVHTGQIVMLKNTGQMAKMLDWDHSPSMARVEITTPSGTKIVSVLKSLIVIIEIIDGFIPLIRALWKMIFPGRKKALIEIDELPVNKLN